MPLSQKKTAYHYALWAALPMAHSPRMEGRLKMILDQTRSRRAPTLRVLIAALGIGAAVLLPLAMLRPTAQAQAAAPTQPAPPSAAISRQRRPLERPQEAALYARQGLLLTYYGEGWIEAHPEAADRAANVKPLRAATLYGSWAEAYGGIKSGKTEMFLRRAQALEPNNPQWPDRLGDLDKMQMIRASPATARTQAQKALAQYERAARLLGPEPAASQSMAVAAFDASEYDKARRYASDLVRRNEHRDSTAQGDDELHHAHLVLGRLALHDGDTAQAEAHLRAMGRVSGSPVLDTFGPNMQLAQDLLDRGDRRPVLAYFDECARFWKMGGSHLAAWKSQVQQGKTPDFGANLVY